MPKPTSASFELFCRRSDLRGELGDRFFLSFSSVILIYIWRFSINNNDYWCWILFSKWFSTIIWGVILKSAPPISVPFYKIYWKKRRVRTSQNEWSNYDYSLLNRLQSGNLCVLYPHHVLLDHRCRHIDSWKYDISIINANE